MCLVDRVTAWDATSIACAADAGRVPHPLRGDHGLSVVHSVEYGAQAAALHCLLQARDEGANGGLLLQIHEARFLVRRLDSLEQPLRIEATCKYATPEAARYTYRIESAGIMVAGGELTTRLMR
ncbi:MAG: hypothetical protein ACREBN_02210 [Burkholderiaceae bacterium]